MYRMYDVEDIYAQLGFGITDPSAIREFIAHAARHMGTEYVLLVGGDTYDYLDHYNLCVIQNAVQPGMTARRANQSAKVELAQIHPGMVEVILGWTLLGDPALILAP